MVGITVRDNFLETFLGLLDPEDIGSLKRLDVVNRLVTETVKGEAGLTLPVLNLGLLDLVFALHPSRCI